MPIPYKRVSEETLAKAIEVVLGDEMMRSKAQELGEKIRGETMVERVTERPKGAWIV
ncbi:hypothetical protein [Komarekiella delphini-convector]|uniref:hypothetical protein n=1 Tax=Komarekiella delphini-convector TaxID=3050158 RepID=UPI0017873E6C|nr:hypothetical protein [Komarekiella delphini-convector]